MRENLEDKKGKLSKEEIKAEIRRKIDIVPDYIYSHAHNYSLQRFMENRNEGVQERKIAQVLQISEEQVELEYQSAIRKIRDYLGVEITASALTPRQIEKEQSVANRKARKRIPKKTRKRKNK